MRTDARAYVAENKHEQTATKYVHQGEYGLDLESVSGLWIRINSKI